MNQQIKNQDDLKQYEQNFPLNLPSSTYQMLCESEAQFGDEKAAAPRWGAARQCAKNRHGTAPWQAKAPLPRLVQGR